MAHEGSTDSFSKYFIPDETIQSDLREEIAAIKWFWPYNKMINLTKAEPPAYVIPFEHKIPTKEELATRSMAAYDFLYREKMIFYKEVYQDGTERIDFCNPLAFITQFLPQEK